MRRGAAPSALAARRTCRGAAEMSGVGVSAGFALLADAVDTIGSFVDVFVAVYILLIFAYILTSWIRLPYSPWLNRIQRFLYDVCEPYLRIFRRIVPQIGPLDLSPMVAVIVLLVVQRVLGSLLSSV
jgi:YggT family protein